MSNMFKNSFVDKIYYWNINKNCNLYGFSFEINNYKDFYNYKRKEFSIKLVSIFRKFL